jgi:hypothetical protein
MGQENIILRYKYFHNLLGIGFTWHAHFIASDFIEKQKEVKRYGGVHNIIIR